MSAPCLNFSTMLGCHVTRQSPNTAPDALWIVFYVIRCHWTTPVFSWIVLAPEDKQFFFQPLASEDFSGNYKPWMTGTGQGERRYWPPSRFGLKLSTTREETECLQLISVLMLAYSSASGDAGLPVLSTLLCGLRWITEITKAVFAHF